jgi:capsular exopolysaccharide synthesis family protein
MFALAWRAVLGGIIGLGIALLLELRDQTLRSEDDLIAAGAGPVLGTVPFDRLVESAPLLVEASRHSSFAEAFRQLRTNLQFVDVEHRVQVLVVTSSVPGEGKSVTCSNLALSLAAAGRQVLLIEADLRLPRISHYFGIDRSVGLTDVLIGRASLEEVVRPIPGTSLTVLPSGHAPPNPSELLGSDSMRAVLAELRNQYDVIVVDTPPLLPVADGAVAAAWADGVVLLVRTAKTPRQQVTLSLRSLSSVGARLVGSVMTMAPQGAGSRYSSYDYRAGDDTPDGKTSVPTLRPRPGRERVPAGGERRPAPERSAAPAHVAGPSRQPVPPPPQPAERQPDTEPVGGFNTHIETLLESGSPEAVRAGLNALKLAKVDADAEPSVPAAAASPKRRSTRGKPRQ